MKPTDRRRGRSGSALIELCLCTPVLALLLFGAMDFGRVYYTAMELTSAAWAGAQYASLKPANQTDTAGISAAVNADAQDIAPITVTSTMVCTCSNGTATACGGGGCASVKKFVQVNATKTFNTLFPYPLIPQSTGLGAVVQVRVP